MIKKIILVAIVLVLFFASFLGYKKYSGVANSKKKFTFWTIQLKPIYEKQINNIITEFENKHPEYQVVWVDIPIQEAQKRTLASILSSTPPDLINLNPDFSHILATRNALDFFNDDELNNFHSGLVKKLKYKNKIYGIPFYATSPVTVYNKAIFDKCGLQIAKTYDELYELSPKLKRCSNVAPLAINLNENDTFFKILNKYDVQEFKTSSEKQNMIEIYSMFNEMYKLGYITKDALTINHREMIEKYMSNQALSIVAGSNFIKMIKQNAPDIYKKSEISAQLTGKNRKYDISLMNLVIPKKSKNKELAREFAFILTNFENQLELAKLTNVLPANKMALKDEYFKNCSNDIEEASRCESVKQLDKILSVDVEIKNRKALNEVLNRALEEFLLDENSDLDSIKAGIGNLFSHSNSLLGLN